MKRSDIPDLLTVFFLSMNKLRYLDMVLECSNKVRLFSVFFASFLFLLMICHKFVGSSICFSYNFSLNCSISKIKKSFVVLMHRNVS